MPVIPFKLPSPIPPVAVSSVVAPPLAGADPSSLYDVAIGGIGFEFANTVDTPYVRETAPLTKDRIDQAQTPGEQTLTGWWIRSQDSFHGGAGQLQLEPAVPTPVSHVRFDCSKNADVFTPGQVTRLPDVSILGAATASAMVPVVVGGADAIAYLTTSGALKLITSLTSSPVTTAFGAITGQQGLATDGVYVYTVNGNIVERYNPASPASAPTAIATAPAATHHVLGWVKSRLMLGSNNAVYEVDVSSTAVTLGVSELKYTHPVSTFLWKCFASGPQAVLAAGDAGGVSTITSFTVQNVSGAAVLQVAGDIGELPVGERVVSMLGVQGSFLAIGTTAGIRIGSYDSFYGRLSFGPLHLSPIDPVIPCNAIVARDRFIYCVGSDYDEAGLLAVDLGTKVDDAGRYAWSPHLVGPAYAPGVAALSGAVTVLSNRLVFSVPNAIYLEGTTEGSARESWVRTSRIRFGTAEPKLFKLGRVRGDLLAGEIQVTAVTPTDQSIPLTTVGFVADDPIEFNLPAPLTEWLQLKLALVGSPTVLASYSVKTLPGTRRQRFIQAVLSMFDTETTKSGQRVRDELSARQRLAQLEELDAKGDEVLLEEFTPNGVVSTIVVIDKLSFKQVGRPTARSDIGGQLNVLMRTVES